jgi:selenium metabolism protein YedF
MIKKIDVRGLECPQPVVRTKKALDHLQEGVLEVIVDNEAASKNLQRLAESSGCTINVKKEKDDFIVTIKKEESGGIQNKKKEKKITFFITSNSIGEGNDKLGSILVSSFFPTLIDTGLRLHRIVFLNSGVELVTKNPAVTDSLRLLEKEGTEILICGTCLDFFNLKDKVKVGKISNMFEIVSTLLTSDKVITI